MSKTCIIGAGASGICIARHLKANNLPYVIYDKSDGIGGLWRYGAKGGNVYASAHLISSRKMTEYPDFPMPDDYPDYPDHRQCCAYFEAYAEHFGLREDMVFNTEITRAVPDGDKWWVSFDNRDDELFDNLVIANGHLSEPKWPEIEGQDSFTGQILHSSEYRTPDIFADKRVLVVGAGNSGTDIAVDAVHATRHVSWSVRSGEYYLPKFIGGRATDSRSASGFMGILPGPIRRPISHTVIKFIMGKPAQYGLPKPEHGFLRKAPVMNSHILHHVRHGDVTVRKPIARLAGDDVVYGDGTREAIDVIVLATGYRVTVPFVDVEHLNWKGGAPDLELNMFPPSYNGLYFAGLIDAAGGGWRVRDYQGRLLAAYLIARRDKPELARWFECQNKGGKEWAVEDGTGQREIFVNYDTYRHRLERFSKKLGAKRAW